MADVTYQRTDYADSLKDWCLVDDVCDSRLKEGREKYLPKPNPTDTSAENDARYDNYIARACPRNFTGFTLQGMVGAAFSKPAQFDHSGLDYMLEDVDGAGVSISQQAQSVLEKVLRNGRCCLFVDYPVTEGSTSKADMVSGGIQATINAYPAKRVYNWKTTKVGSKCKLSLVVMFDDQEEDSEDGFGVNVIKQRRVLRLLDGVYVVELWRCNGDGDWINFQSYTPTNGSGQPWKEIPFTFVGSTNNDPEIDKAPMLDLAKLNVHHYMNSADYEDSVYMCGQVQPWASGVTPAWYDLYKKEGIYIGSRQLFPVPEGGTFDFAQAGENSMVRQAMLDKVDDMIKHGARLVLPGGAVKTATQALAENETNHSVLSLAVKNVSDAYTKCLRWAAQFMNLSGQFSYEINQEFTKPTLDAQQLTALIGAWQSGQYPSTDLWAQLRKNGLIDPEKTDEEIRGELEMSDAGLGLDEE